MIKMYDDGKLTRVLKDLRPRDEVMIRGPRGNLHYEGNGVFRRVSSSAKSLQIGQYDCRRNGLLLCFKFYVKRLMMIQDTFRLICVPKQ